MRPTDPLQSSYFTTGPQAALISRAGLFDLSLAGSRTSHRRPAAPARSDPADLVFKEGVAVRLVHVHRSAEHDQSGHPVQWQSLGSAAIEIDTAARKTGGTESRLNRSQGLVGHVLKSEDRFH